MSRPALHLAGDVHVAEGAFVGVGAAIIPGRRIGAWSTVGAGAAVVTDVPDEATRGRRTRPARSTKRSMSVPRVYLSSPHMGGDELALIKRRSTQNWIAPLGPHVDAFERELAAYVGVAHAAALSAGTAALHLALRLLGVQRGDEVLCSSLTFSASANPIAYEGAEPVFIDSERATWNMDPALLAGGARSVRQARASCRRPLIVVDLYGQSAD